MDWIDVKDKLPDVDFNAVLVRISNSDIPAMAVFVGAEIDGYWKIQPLFANWYPSNSKVTHWMAIPKLP